MAIALGLAMAVLSAFFVIPHTMVNGEIVNNGIVFEITLQMYFVLRIYNIFSNVSYHALLLLISYQPQSQSHRNASAAPSICNS